MRTAELTFAIHRLRRRHDDLFHWEPVLDDELEQQRSSHGVDVKESGEIQHVILIGSLMRDDVNALERREQSDAVGHISMDELHVRGQPRRTASGMDSWLQTIQNADLKTLLQEAIYEMGTDESGAAGHENYHCETSLSNPRSTIVSGLCFRNYFPEPRSTSRTVSNKILASSVSDHSRIYFKSKPTHSSKS